MSGPWVGAAFMCEKVLTESDGVHSYIRVHDRKNVMITGPDAPENMPPVPLNATLVVQLRAGDTIGRYEVGIRPERPSGHQLETTWIAVTFEGMVDNGVNLHSELADFTLDEEGLWWFDVVWQSGGEVMTRIPYRVIFRRVT